MRDFSDIPKVVLILARIMCIFFAGLIGVIMAFIYWQRQFALNADDRGAFIVMSIVAAACLVLAALMKREIKRM